MLQEAIALKYMQDMSYVEIAQKLGVPDGTVKSRVYRGPIPACMQIIETGLQSLTGGE
jgi:DNA-directed RNA polymerase specialized sigma24 family protein